jgi:tetratricopeptide (TPR) repeat protein
VIALVLAMGALIAADLGSAWDALRAGRLEAAQAAFAAALSADPARVEALDGLGYLALRSGSPRQAEGLFDRALALDAADRDARVGRAYARAALGRGADALTDVQTVLRASPDDAEARALHDRLRADGAAEAAPTAEARLPARRVPVLDLPMRVRDRVFQLRGAEGAYRPLFLKAINLGPALPGRYPSQPPVDPAVYREWFAGMKDGGFQAVRVYTILPPAFYDALLEFNRDRPDPLYLVHGLWIELPEDDDFADPEFIEDYHADIRRLVDLVHGALDLPVRPGHAGGRYRSDVSRYWVATILGREWEPFSVLSYDARNPGRADHQGRFVTGRGLSASERWQAERMDYAVAYETDRWNAQRPIAFTNWPTLDPLAHPTESTAAEERVWQRRLGLFERRETGRDYDDDAATLDMEKMEATARNQGGLFASYHVYPYHPDFMTNDPGYRRARDVEGPSAYAGYLQDLLRHHRSHPVFVAEFGVPTSRDVVHVQPQGWTHGGHNEVAQGTIDARLLRGIHESGAAGASLFAWIDEWFKHTWITRPWHVPADRNPLWHDRQCPEQHFGLVACRPGAGGPVVVIDGKDTEWREDDVLLRAPRDAVGPLRALAARSDASDLFLLLRVAPGTRASVVVAIDVLDPRRGSRVFPAGLDVDTAVAFDAALLWNGSRARVVLADNYDKSALRHRMRIESDQHDQWVAPRIVPNRLRISRAGEVFDEVVLEVGELRRGTTDRRSRDYDDQAEWQYDAVRGVAEFRIPWGLLNVTDPSSRTVVVEADERAATTTATEGLRFAAAAFAPGSRTALDVLPRPSADGRIRDLPLYAWPTWDEPAYHCRPKRSFDIFKEALRTVPDAPARKP